jgi:hypothetical protein
MTAWIPRRLLVVVALTLALIGLGNLGRAAMALHYARMLPDLPLTVPWAYLAGMGAFWGVAMMACAVGLAWRRPWGRRATLAVATLYQAHIWLNHLLFDASDYARQTRPRDLALSALFLALVWGILHLPGVRKILETSHKDKTSHKDTKAQRNN